MSKELIVELSEEESDDMENILNSLKHFKEMNVRRYAHGYTLEHENFTLVVKNSKITNIRLDFLPHNIKSFIVENGNVTNFTWERNMPYETLSFRNNKISGCSFDAHTLKCKYLNLDSNIIETIKINNIICNKISLNYNQIVNVTFIGCMIRHLSLSHNKIVSPIWLPDSLVYLDLSHNLMTDVHHKFPKSIETLILSHNNIKFMSDTCIPSRLKHLDVSFNCFENFYVELPKTMISLKINNNRIKNSDFLFSYYAFIESINCTNMCVDVCTDIVEYSHFDNEKLSLPKIEKTNDDFTNVDEVKNTETSTCTDLIVVENPIPVEKPIIYSSKTMICPKWSIFI